MANPGAVPADVASCLASKEGQTLGLLKDLCRIPSVSYSITESPEAEPRPQDEGFLRSAASLLAQALGGIGLEDARLVDLPGAAPYVVAQWSGARGQPTLLLYGHYDVQPPGRPELWTSPAFEPAERGTRLYARGAADDKGGCVAIVAALGAWLEAEGRLPINVRVLLEGEEEIGSPHFGAFLEANPGLAQADAVLVCDGGNLELGRPAVAYTARGALSLRVTVEAIKAPLHSGLYGGALPDPAATLCSLLGRLVDDRGRIAVPGLYDQVAEPSPAESQALSDLDLAGLRQAAGLVPGADFWGEEGYSLVERLWLRPSITVCALEGRPVKDLVAAYMERARAILILRTVPRMDTKAVAGAVLEWLRAQAPRGCHITVESPLQVGWWRTEPEDPLILACLQALESGYGRPAIRIGEGGTVGILGHLSAGGRPCALLGVEDAACSAHGEDEGVDIADLHAFARSLAAVLPALST